MLAHFRHQSVEGPGYCQLPDCDVGNQHVTHVSVTEELCKSEAVMLTHVEVTLLSW